MPTSARYLRYAALLLMFALGALVLTAACGGDDDEEPTPTQRTQPPTATASSDDPTATSEPAATATADTASDPTATTVSSDPTATQMVDNIDGMELTAASAEANIDGDSSDWASIAGLNVTLKQFDIPSGSDWEFDGEVAPKSAVLKVAADDTNVYVLVEVEDSFDYIADDHKFSPALGVMFAIEQDAGPHMGSGDDDFEEGLGMVDLWHWELDCAAGQVSGGGDPGSGDDPDCNMDDEYATDPEEREDDDGDGAENSLAGSWSHSSSTIGADGTWTFEMSRPLNTGDATDAQFASGETVLVALAYWDPKEGPGGWSDAGHLTSADLGWLEVTLP